MAQGKTVHEAVLAFHQRFQALGKRWGIEPLDGEHVDMARQSYRLTLPEEWVEETMAEVAAAGLAESDQDEAYTEAVIEYMGQRVGALLEEAYQAVDDAGQFEYGWELFHNDPLDRDEDGDEDRLLRSGERYVDFVVLLYG